MLSVFLFRREKHVGEKIITHYLAQKMPKPFILLKTKKVGAALFWRLTNKKVQSREMKFFKFVVNEW